MHGFWWLHILSTIFFFRSHMSNLLIALKLLVFRDRRRGRCVDTVEQDGEREKEEESARAHRDTANFGNKTWSVSIKRWFQARIRDINRAACSTVLTVNTEAHKFLCFKLAVGVCGAGLRLSACWKWWKNEKITCEILFAVFQLQVEPDLVESRRCLKICCGHLLWFEDGTSFGWIQMFSAD